MTAALRLPELATWEDLLAIPEGDRLHELLAGEIVERAAPSGEHGGGQRKMAAFVDPFERRRSGRWPGGWWFTTETEILLGPHDLVRPDLAGWRRERCPDPPRGCPVHLRPDWVCEVLSPSTRQRDLVDKARIYHAFEIHHYWILDLEATTLTVLRWEESGWVTALVAQRDQTVRAEPFDAIPLVVGVLFGDDPTDEAP